MAGIDRTWLRGLAGVKRTNQTYWTSINPGENAYLYANGCILCEDPLSGGFTKFFHPSQYTELTFDPRSADLEPQEAGPSIFDPFVEFAEKAIDENGQWIERYAGERIDTWFDAGDFKNILDKYGKN